MALKWLWKINKRLGLRKHFGGNWKVAYHKKVNGERAKKLNRKFTSQLKVGQRLALILKWLLKNKLQVNSVEFLALNRASSNYNLIIHKCQNEMENNQKPTRLRSKYTEYNRIRF